MPGMSFDALLQFTRNGQGNGLFVGSARSDGPPGIFRRRARHRSQRSSRDCQSLPRETTSRTTLGRRLGIVRGQVDPPVDDRSHRPDREGNSEVWPSCFRSKKRRADRCRLRTPLSHAGNHATAIRVQRQLSGQMGGIDVDDHSGRIVEGEKTVIDPISQIEHCPRAVRTGPDSQISSDLSGTDLSAAQKSSITAIQIVRAG